MDSSVHFLRRDLSDPAESARKPFVLFPSLNCLYSSYASDLLRTSIGTVAFRQERAYRWLPLKAIRTLLMLSFASARVNNSNKHAISTVEDKREEKECRNNVLAPHSGDKAQYMFPHNKHKSGLC